MAEPPIDPDVDLRAPAVRSELVTRPWAVLSAISAGGVIGSLGRYGLQQAFPHSATGFPWATFGINVTGCLVIGVLMVFVTEVFTDRPLLRPFLGVGVLGGFTTFSTYAVDTQQAIAAGATATALLYLGGTLCAALTAVWVGHTVTARLLRTGRSS